MDIFFFSVAGGGVGGGDGGGGHDTIGLVLGVIYMYFT